MNIFSRTTPTSTQDASRSASPWCEISTVGCFVLVLFSMLASGHALAGKPPNPSGLWTGFHLIYQVPVKILFDCKNNGCSLVGQIQDMPLCGQSSTAAWATATTTAEKDSNETDAMWTLSCPNGEQMTDLPSRIVFESTRIINVYMEIDGQEVLGITLTK